MRTPSNDSHRKSRREFLKSTSLGGIALVLGVGRDGHILQMAHAATLVDFEPNQWIRIDSSGAVVITAARAEMGQGVHTALPMIIAEELGADWNRVSIAFARPGAQFPNMRTSGSGSVGQAWGTLRAVAATARDMLILAASQSWNVPLTECVATDGSVVHRPSGRRLAFGELVSRAAALAVPSQPAVLKTASEYRLLGTRVPRVNSQALVNGQAVYGIDARPRDMAVAMIARPPEHGATVHSVDDRATRAMPGVLNVVQVPSGIAVIASNTWQAMRARDALVVQWAPGPEATRGSADYSRDLRDAIARGKPARTEGGPMNTALASSAREIQATYSMPFQAHAALEPLSCIADVKEGRCELTLGTQAPNEVQRDVAALLGIAPEAVTVNTTLLGGAFGRRLATDYALEAVHVSRAAGRPVQLVWSREDDTRHDFYQPGQLNEITAGLNADGMPVAWRHRVADFNLTMFGPYDPNYDPAADGDPWGAFDTPYTFPSLEVTFALLPSPAPTGAWRSVAYPAAVFARECFLDEVARAASQDPLALRLALLQSPGNLVGRTLTLPNGDRLRHVLQLAAERANWHEPFVREREGRRWGRGIACNVYHQTTMVAQVAEVSVGAAGDLRVHRVVCAVDCGQVINRLGVEGQFESGVLWALSALRTQVTFRQGRTVQGNYNDFAPARLRDAPIVEVHIVPSTFPPFGVGEQPVPPVIPAVLNAAFDATGQRVRDLPLRQDHFAASSAR